MALPTAHCALALGLAPCRSFRAAALVCFICLLPDFDFLLVLAGHPIEACHRTFSHSLAFCACLTALWAWVWPARWRWISPSLFFAVLVSHSALDMLCTADRFDHGVLFFWPLSDIRLGWPVLVPLYRLLADSPFSMRGAILFTLLEAVLAWPLWKLSRLSAGVARQFGGKGQRRASAADARLPQKAASASGRNNPALNIIPEA